MVTLTTIRKMFGGNKIIVPANQGAYSWEAPSVKNITKTEAQTDVFVSDIEDYNRSKAKTPYDFGHFIFEEISESEFAVSDGQQRLTTIVILLSALFAKLGTTRWITEEEEVLYEDVIRRKHMYKFSTVDRDNQLFRDFVIERTRNNRNYIDSESGRRIVEAFDYFTDFLNDKDENYLAKMLATVSQALCHIHLVKKESGSNSLQLD